MSRTLTIEFKFFRKSVFGLMVLFFITGHPRILGSETLQLTTYYPAPYGGYARLLTTDNTYLARDGGNVGIGTQSPSQKLDVSGNARVTGQVQWGGSRGTLRTDQGASIELGGSGTPYIDFSNKASGDYDMRLMLGGDDRLRVEGGDVEFTRDIQVNRDVQINRNMRIYGSVEGNLTVQGDVMVGGSLRSVCTWRYFGMGGWAWPCIANETGMGTWGDGVLRLYYFVCAIPSGTSCVEWTSVADGFDWAGWMYCCRIR
ncbi:MAG: hypothetical protein HY746_01860 [Elusimicrobia bacterium]|nr:hypothetical protein [Elusimicrobiota bacterium]